MLITFNEFCDNSDRYLSEAAKGQQGAGANSKGVAFETGLTAALHHQGKHAEMHPNDDGMTAEQAWNHHYKNLSGEEQKKLTNSLPASAEALRNALHSRFGIHPKNKINIHWTSKPGQLARSTGHEEDHDNPGDILIHDPKTNQHVAVSLKYGDKPGLRSPGYEDLHKMAKMDIDHDAEHSFRSDLIKLGGKTITGDTAAARHKSFREAESNPKAAKVIDAINKRSLEYRKEKMGNLTTGLNNNLNHEEKTMVARRLLNAEKTKTPMLKLNTHPTKGPHISDPAAEFENLKSKVRNWRFEHNGMYIHLKAEDHEGNVHHIANIGMKHNSSPMTHLVGNVSGASGYQQLLDREVRKPGASATTTSSSAPQPTTPAKKAAPAKAPAPSSTAAPTTSVNKPKAVAAKKVKPFKDVADAPATKKVAKPESEYDYLKARSQDLGKLSKSGDEKAVKEIERRKKVSK